MGNNCASESDSLIDEDSHDQLNRKNLRPGIHATEHHPHDPQDEISVCSSPDSPYPICYRDQMDVIAFKHHKYSIFEKNSIYYGEINRLYQKDGKGKLYTKIIDSHGNQKIVIKKGLFKNGEFVQPDSATPGRKLSEDTFESKMTDSPCSPDSTNSLPLIDTQKYNKSICEKDLNSINEKNQLRSNIVDGYIEYLQQLDEQMYWNTIPEKREQFNRTIIFSSSQKLEYGSFKKAIEPFKYVKFWLLYKKIGFVVKHDSDHWYFVEVKITEDEFNIIIYDSLKCIQGFYKKIQDKLETLFTKLMNQKLESKLIIKDDIPQSYNTYDSAVYTCIFARMLRCNCKNKNLNLSTEKMREDLIQIFTS